MIGRVLRFGMETQQQWFESFRSFISRFVEISDRQFDDLKAILQTTYLRKGEFFEGSTPESVRCGYIIKGLIRTYFITEDGKEFTTDFCKENDVTTNYDLLTSDFSQEYTSEAVEDSIILAMDHGRFMELAEKHPPLQVFKNALIEYYYGEKLNREKSLLSMSAEGRYLRFLGTHQHILHRIPQYHIASYLGITPVALSRIKKELRDE